jgi:hypothetical protein
VRIDRSSRNEGRLPDSLSRSRRQHVEAQMNGFDDQLMRHAAEQNAAVAGESTDNPFW